MLQGYLARFVLETLLGLLGTVGLVAQPNVTIQFSNVGLSSLEYNGIEFLSYGDFRLNQLTLRDSNGQTSAGSLDGKIKVDPSRQELTKTFNWGSIVVNYAPVDNRLNVTVTVNNHSPFTIEGIWFEPFGLRFPSRVLEYDGSIPLLVNTLGQPAVVSVTYNSGTMVLAADDVAKPLQLGFPWALDKPLNTTFPLTLNTDRVSSYPNNCPTIIRPIAPGSSDQFRFSLRFGPPAVMALGGDVHQTFKAAFPSSLNWPDRRPIGALFLSTAATRWPTNPRGWLMDPAIDVTKAAGITNLRTRILSYADTSIGILKSMNAQGMITWDIEGQQYRHPISYVGDPRLFSTLAPEMADVADDYFKRFRDAGLRVGVCIRPQQFIQPRGESTAKQVSVSDPAQLLMDKIRFAKNRWGATLFYVDSNVNATDPNPIDVSVFQKLAAAFPDVLFIPEHSNVRYYAYTAPFKELRQGYASTTWDTRLAYPKAFSVIYTADGPIDQRFRDLAAAVARGDILLFRGWFNDPQNAKVKTIYQQAASHPH